MTNPNVIVKTGEAGPQTKRVLSVRERESLEKTVNIYGYANTASDNYMPGSQGANPVNVPWLNVNRTRLNEQQKQVMKVLRDGTPEPVSGSEKDALIKRAEMLKAQFEPFLQTREEIRVVKRDNPAFFSALEKHKVWSQPNKNLGGRTPEQVADEYRNIMRRVEPEDEFADSLDKLRKPR